MTKARPALASVVLLTTRGLLSLVLGACAFAQNARPPDTLNPTLLQFQHTSWTERDGAPPAINGIAQAPDGSLWVGSSEGLYRFDGFTFERVRAIDGDSPAPTEVYTLLATSNGDLWIGTSYNGAILLRNGVAKRFPKFEGIPLNTTAKTSRTSITVSLVGDVEGAIASMASDAMDTCYKSRTIGFGNRKFDGANAVKLINGLVKRGVSVSEGDVLWSAIENFAGPLELVRPEAQKRLDPSGSDFYQNIRKKIEKQGGAGIDLKTVYNWFTGYNKPDGIESAGLTRRMVDIYLLCLAQQGVIRISQSKGGGYIDRSSISGIDFKPDVLRGMNRIELPRAPGDWELFAPYLEVLAGRPDGDLGPKYDKAKAEEALRFWWESRWLNGEQVDRTDHYVKELFTILGKSDKSPFDELLLYWMAFAEEARPDTFQEDQVFDALRRAVLKASVASHPDDLTGEHLSTFRDNHRRFAELEDSFGKTSVLLIRAAKFASAPLPDQRGGTGEIRKVQQEVLKELEAAEELMLNPDSASTRLKPRFERLEGLYTEAFLSDLMRLDSLQGQLDELGTEAKKSNEVQALADFAGDVPEAEHNLTACLRALESIPPRLRKTPEDRDRAEKEMKQEAKVKDIRNADLSYQRCSTECTSRLEAQPGVSGAGGEALARFAAFLKSPSVVEQLKAAKPVPKLIQEILAADTAGELAEVLITMPSKHRRELAKSLKILLGNKKAKLVRLSSFDPQTETIWESPDIDRVVAEFREYLTGQWEPGVYLKIED